MKSDFKKVVIKMSTAKSPLKELDVKNDNFSNENQVFISRGIRIGLCNCFVCGANERNASGSIILNVLKAKIQNQSSCDKIVAMFGQGAKPLIDDNAVYPVQIIIGACDEHIVNLKTLEELTDNGFISDETIAMAKTTP